MDAGQMAEEGLLPLPLLLLGVLLGEMTKEGRNHTTHHAHTHKHIELNKLPLS
jgi:hypothetical protein